MADGLDKFLGAVARKDEEAGRAFYAMRAADAQRATKANRLSRGTGIPADTVERNLPELEAQQRGRRGASIIQGNPNLTRWFGDLRNSAASVDDIDGLSAVSAIIGMNPRTTSLAASEMLAKPSSVPIERRAAGIRDRAADKEAAIRAARPKSTPGSWWTGTAVGTVEGFKQAWTGANMYMADALGFEELIPEQKEAYAASLDRVRANTPTEMSRTGEATYGALISLGQMVPSLTAAVLTGPVGGLAVAGGQTGLSSYGKYRERGGTRNEALVGGALEGAIEIATEAAPLGVVARRFGKSGTGKFLGEFLGKEMLGEQVATLGQDAVDTAVANPNATWDDYWKARPGAAFDTAVAVGIASGAVGGVHHAVRALAPVERDIQHATAGVAGATFLDNVMTGAVESKLRERDPDAFQQFVEQHTEGSPVENIYIPGETVRSLMQSDTFDMSDPSHSWIADYADEADNAAALGGDVVVPLAVASAKLAGSPLWETLRDDVRLSPGGMSLREAKTFETEYADVMESAGRQAAADREAELGAEPVRRVYEDVVSQARGAGLGLNAARSVADLWASHYQSRAERTGRDAWAAYQDFAPKIVQEMPDTVARYRAADQMDVLINSMRRGSGPKATAGPSLLEFIAREGGIEDKGGDIRSMGGDAWHKAKSFRRRLIRPFGTDAPGFAGMGADATSTGFGLDDFAQKAADAGYFPGLAERPTPNDLLEAIDAELRGTPRYAEANSTADDTDALMVAAADDLRAHLDARGLDPDTATRAEIDTALSVEGPTSRRPSYDQAAPVSTLVGDEIAPLDADDAALRQAAKAWFKANLSGAKIQSTALRGAVQFTNSRKPISSSADPRKLRLFAALPDLVANAPEVDTRPPIDGASNVKAWHYLRGAVDLAGETLNVTLSIREDNNGNFYYNHVVEDAPSELAGPTREAGGGTEGSTYDQPVAQSADGLNLSLDQTTPSGPRGRIDFNADGTAIIRLFEGRDLSTLLHESGHLWLEELRRDAESAALRNVQYHGSPNPNLTLESVRIIGGEGRKQGKKGRVYGGFYAAGVTGLNEAKGYTGENGTIYRVDLKEGSVVEDKEGDITRLTEDAINEYRARGVDVVRGRDPRGRVEYAIINQDAIGRLIDKNEVGDNPGQLVADWEAIKAWFAAEGHPIIDGVIPVDAHEMWARGIERYLLEGNAPAPSLDRAFSAFRSWLVRIYKAALNLNANLTDDVRGVMGRLIATDDAIAAANTETESRPLFDDAIAAGMTEQEFEAYRGSVVQTRTDAYNALLKQTMDVIRRSRTASWRAERKGVRAEVEGEIRARPEFRALALMRGIGGERIQLDRAAVVNEFGTDALAMIPRGVPPTVVEKGGVHPDILAERVGMRTGREMVELLMGIQQRENELRGLGDKRSALDEVIDIQTDSTVRDRHGDVLGNGSIEEEAVAAIHNDSRATILATEIRALAKIGKQEAVTPWRAAKAWAERTVREGTVGDQASAAALARHLRNEMKAGRAAERAMLAGDIEEAFQAKQRQMLNHALYRAAKGAKDEVDAIVKRLGKLAAARTLPSMDQEYLERIHDLLEAYDFKRRSAADIRERSSFADWVKEKEEAGEEVYVPARLRTAGDVNFTKLAVEDIIGLADTVQSIAHLGRLKKKILVAREERDFDQMLTEAEAAAASLPERAVSSDRNPKRSTLRAVDAMMVKTEFLADQLDAGNPNGVFNQVLVQNATRAANEKARLQETVLAPLAKLYLDMPATQQRRLQERVEVPEFIHPETNLPTVFSRMEILAIALNTGNEGNLDKMLRGERWSSLGVDSVLARELNELDWKFVESVWRQIDVLWPDIKRSEEALSGVAPEKVEPRMVTTPYGTITGGYYPVVYDPTRNQRIADNYEQDAQKLLGQMGRVISTPKGHTVERTGYAAPIMLSVEAVLLNHINRVTTRIAYGRYVRDALKFINNPRIKAIVDRKMGPEYFRNLKPWLQRQVNEASLDTNTLASLDRLFRTFRVNTTMVGLGFRITTMLAQLGGLPNSAAQIGGKWLAVGMAEATASAGSSPRETLMGQGPARRFVFERSEEMARRAQDFDRDIAAAFRDMQGKSSPLDGVRAMAFWGIGAVDVNLVAIPTWLGAYRKGLSEGMTEEQAASYGDKAVRTSQGSGRAKDLSEIQNANEGYRVLTLFYSAFNVLYNQQRQTVQAARRGDWRKVATNTWWLAMAGPLLSAFMTGDWPQKDEDWLTWAIRKVFFGLWAGVPVVRDLAGIADRKVAGQFSKGLDGIGQLPTSRAFSSAGAMGTDAFNALAGTRAYTELRASFPNLPEGGELSERWVKHAIEAPGYFVGLPTGQASASAQFLYDVERDAAEPEGTADWYTGLTKGRISDKDDQR